MNVLLTSIGRRVSLTRAFQKEVAAYCPGGRVLGADVTRLSAGFQIADLGVLVPRCTAPEYVPQLLEIVRRERVRVIVPLIDTELPVLAQNRELFQREGCEVIVSDLEQVLTTRDKSLTAKRFRELGFETPQLIQASELANPGALQFPLFLKPSDGSSSIGAVRIGDPTELRYWLDHTRSPVVQTLEGGEEFTIDVFCDSAGVVRCVVPRRRLSVRAGEIAKGVTVKDRAMMSTAARLVTALGGCRGCVTLQCFRQPNDRFVFFEMNMRFGGGFPLSYAAGANFPGWILRMVDGETIPSFDGWEDQLLMLRYDAEVFARGDGA